MEPWTWPSRRMAGSTKRPGRARQRQPSCRRAAEMLHLDWLPGSLVSESLGSAQQHLSNTLQQGVVMEGHMRGHLLFGPWRQHAHHPRCSPRCWVAEPAARRVDHRSRTCMAVLHSVVFLFCCSVLLCRNSLGRGTLSGKTGLLELGTRPRLEAWFQLSSQPRMVCGVLAGTGKGARRCGIHWVHVPTNDPDSEKRVLHRSQHDRARLRVSCSSRSGFTGSSLTILCSC